MSDNDYAPPIGDFQPADPVEDREAMLEAWLDSKENAGFVVMTRDEMRQRLDAHATEAYAEGRKDEHEDLERLLAWAYSKLHHISFGKQEDALAMDEIKLLLTGSAK